MTDRLPSPSLLAFFTPSLFIIFIPHSAFPIFPIFLFLSHFSLLSLHYFIPSTLLSPSALPFPPSHLHFSLPYPHLFLPFFPFTVSYSPFLLFLFPITPAPFLSPSPPTLIFISLFSHFFPYSPIPSICFILLPPFLPLLPP